MKVDRWARRHLIRGQLEPGEERKVLHEFKDKDSKPTGSVLVLRTKAERRVPVSNADKWFPKRGHKDWGGAIFILGLIYSDLHPEPKSSRTKRMARYNRPWHQKREEYAYKIHRACQATMKDLLTPTYVRDIYFNAKDKGDHLATWEDERPESVKYYEHAGIAGKLACKPSKD